MTKAEPSRQCRISRRTIHHWIETGQWYGDLAAGRTQYAPRFETDTQAEPVQGDHRGTAGGVPEAVGAAAVRGGAGVGTRGRLRAGAGPRAERASATAGAGDSALRRRRRGGRAKWTLECLPGRGGSATCASGAAMPLATAVAAPFGGEQPRGAGAGQGQPTAGSARHGRFTPFGGSLAAPSQL